MNGWYSGPGDVVGMVVEWMGSVVGMVVWWAWWCGRHGGTMGLSFPTTHTDSSTL